LLAVVASLLVRAPGAEGAQKPVMVHYMPWFVSKPYSGSWGWHWTMNHYNPSLLNSSGQAQIASWHYPLLGPYDSLEPAVLECQVLQMRLAGIDGVIVDWYGMDNFNDYAVNNQRTLALFNYARKAGLKFALCYEDSTIQQEINGNFITAPIAILHAQQTLLYAQSNFFSDSAYLRLNGSPVLLNFGPQCFTNNSDWASIFSVLNSTNHPAFFTEDNRLPVGSGAFNWPPMWLSGGGTNTLTPSQLESYLANFEQKAARWPAFVSSAFPRFYDVYAQAGARASYGYLDDANGATLINTLSRAMTNRSAIVQLVTWNDFGEGTSVEPTAEYGFRDLALIQSLRRQYLQPGFTYNTNDLAMAFRFYHLRKQYSHNAAISAELDRVFTNIISGAAVVASRQLTGIESNPLAIYNHKGDDRRFSAGSYAPPGARVQVSTEVDSAESPDERGRN
jgi:hypothetical protein